MLCANTVQRVEIFAALEKLDLTIPGNFYIWHQEQLALLSARSAFE